MFSHQDNNNTMNSTVRGIVTLTFVMGGVSKKTKKLYLQVSDGVEAKFINFAKDSQFPEDAFDQYSRGDTINLDIEVDPFAGRMTVVGIE